MNKQKLIILSSLFLLFIAVYLVFILINNSRSKLSPQETLQPSQKSAASPTLTKGLSITESQSGTNVFLKTKDIEWFEYPVEIDGKTYFFKMQKGATIPPREQLEKLIKK